MGGRSSAIQGCEKREEQKRKKRERKRYKPAFSPTLWKWSSHCLRPGSVCDPMRTLTRMMSMEIHKAKSWNFFPLQVQQGHPVLLLFSPSVSQSMAETFKECIVCHQPLVDSVRTLPCFHSACLGCLEQWISQ